MIYDLTRPITPNTATFPGDTAVQLWQVAQMQNGASCNVSALTMSVHAGTHIDAPKHYSDDGVGIDQVPLSVLMGRVRVISILADDVITRAELETKHLTNVQRLIVHTRNSDTPNDVFDVHCVYFDEAAADYIGSLGISLIGTDAPSVDKTDSKALPAHHAFLRHNVIIAENLCLRGVPDGDYDLIALPMSIAGCDAAPARVILIQTSPM